MNTATLKINSFENKNSILVNNEIVGINSEFMNYYSKPIVPAAKKILETLEAEFNDEFEFNVYGNLFEQKYVSFLCQENDYCCSCSVCDTEIAIPTIERIHTLLEFSNAEITIPVALQTDIADIHLPQYPGVQFLSDGSEKIIVSDNISYIRQFADAHCKIAFLKGGKTRWLGKLLVIGCEPQELQDLICSYIDTGYLNAEIFKLANSLNLAEKSIIHRVDPFFFTKKEIELDVDGVTSLEIQSVPANANTDNITIKVIGESVTSDHLTLTGVSEGESIVELFLDSPIPFATAKVLVHKHIYVEKILIEIDSESDGLFVGQTYPISVVLEPFDAEDADSLNLMTSDNNIAVINGKAVTILSAGEFSIRAKTKHITAEKTVSAISKVSSITLSSFPETICFGDVLEIKATVHPENAHNKKYKWITSDNSVAIVGIDNNGKEVVQAKGIGNAKITCVSLDDESIYAELPVSVSPIFDANDSNIEKTINIFSIIFAYIFALLTRFLYWSILILSGYLIVKSYRKHKENIQIPCIALTLSLILYIIVRIL